MDKYIGKLLDNRYEILQLIGTGGMARVYKARCHRLNRLVAVKILKEEFAKDDEFRNRFHAESHAVAMLSHPNIVGIYDVSRSTSIEYIVMELIEGMTLKQYIDHKGTLTVKESLHFITQILKALRHAHNKGIIHRDIKPHNMMLLRDGTIKVADFGIARFTATQRTLTNEALGSVHYISPEQARAGDVDARADIYSTGVMLYEMLCGRLPYEGDSAVSIAIQHINSMPLSPREINSEIPEALEKITMKAMCSDVKKRYYSCDEMLADLEEFRKNPNVVISDDEFFIDDDEGVEDEDKTRKIKTAVPERKDNTSTFDTSDLFDEDDSPSKAPLIAGIIAGGIFLFGVIALLVTIFGGNTSVISIPSLEGEVYDEVIASELYEDFQIIEDGREFNSEFEAGKIISQRPEAGKEVKKNTQIFVVISQGAKLVKVSDVVNMTEKQARIELENRLGLTVKLEYENSDDILEDYVIRTIPEADTEIPIGETVTVYLSKGKDIKKTKVPNLYGMTQNQALRELEASNLIIGEVKEENSKRPKGTVISQSVEKDTEVDEKTSIDIVISTGADENIPVNTDKPVDKPVDPTPQPEPEPEDKNTRTIPIKLPTEPESFTVKVKVNGADVYSKKHNASEKTAYVKITGEGLTTVSIYIDDTLYNEISVDFN